MGDYRTVGFLEGGLVAPEFNVGMAVERADVLAYLVQRRDNAAAIAASGAADGETRALAQDRRRQLDVLIDELTAGMHVWAAEMTC